MKQLPRLKVSDNQRFLVTENGEPFFWLGDTAWELFHRFSREEADFYLDNRRQKGFSVIQAVALAEIDGLHTPNPYGETPLHEDDPTRPNNDYFEHVDYIVRAAHARGLYIGFLPTWADKVLPLWAKNSVPIFTPENAYQYGRFLGERYRDDSNIIWILGGDRPVVEHEELWARMAQGITDGAGRKDIMTFHPSGGSTSSKWFHTAEWLDFNMLQSGHGQRDVPNWEMIERDYALQPAKPVLDGEPNYEDHAINWQAANGYFDDYDVRRQTYRALFAGAFGHTYGHQSVWQAFTEGRQPIAYPRVTWQEAIDRPGAAQLIHARSLMLSRPFLTRIPDQSLLLSDEGEGAHHIQATRDSEGSYAFVYIPVGARSITINTSKLSGQILRAWWYNPRHGDADMLGEFSNNGKQTFDVPGWGPDWVLVLDNAARQFTTPGQVS